MGLGLKLAGFNPAWAIECNADACATYRAMLRCNAICKKIEDVDFRDMPAKVSGLAFGFPCNDFSLVGERKGTTGYFGGLYREAERALHVLRPQWFIAENVPGLMTAGGGGIMQVFANAGYHLSVHLFKFEDYGVPQRRHRVIGVGIRSDIGRMFRPPAPVTSDSPIGARAALQGVEQVATNNELPRHTAKVIQLLEAIPPGENCWHEAVPEELRLNVKKIRMSLIYRRLHPDHPSYTVVAAGGGGTHGYHYEQPRALTNRERARLQSFPDDFVFSGGTQSVRKQIGMAVPPLGAKNIGVALAKTLRGEDYASVSPSVGEFYPGGMQ